MRSMFRTVLVTVVAVLALSAVGSSSASALVGGPEWLVAGASLQGTKTIASTGKGPFRFKETLATAECQKESSTGGTIVGGIPGTGKIKLVFTECSLEGKAVASCAVSSGNVKGEIQVPFETVLAYPPGSKAHAYEALVPEEAVTLAFEGPQCGALNGQKWSLRASGSEIKEPAFNKKCGLLAEVGKIVAGSFVKTESGMQAAEGALNLPASSISEGELWEPGPKAYKSIKCKMEFASLGAVVTVGLAKVETTPVEEFGWKI